MQVRSQRLRRWSILVASISVALTLAVSPANSAGTADGGSADTTETDDGGVVAPDGVEPGSVQETDIASEETCPVPPPPTGVDYRGPDVWTGPDSALASAPTPPAMGAWDNLWDFQTVGYSEPWGTEPWQFASGFARLICGTAEGADVKIGMYFIRALQNGSAQPEYDANAIYDALEWVKVHRHAKISLVLEGMNSCSLVPAGSSCTEAMASANVRELVAERWKSIGDVIYCINGCMNATAFGTNFFGISHEKFIAISDTIWPNPNSGTGPDPSVHPLVVSSSTNWARSQMRSYVQDAMFVYDDYLLWKEFDGRFDVLESCALQRCQLAKDAAANPADPGTSILKLVRPTSGTQKDVWASSVYRRATDSGKGTEIIYSPQYSDFQNAYVNQLDQVNCAVDDEVRVAMFSMTDGLAQDMATRLVALKKAGCDVDVLLSRPGGGRSLSTGVTTTLTKAGIPYACAARSMHTKLILIGPKGRAGSVMEGTQNMSLSGQLFSDEHIISIKPHNATKPGYRQSMADVYFHYKNSWDVLKRLQDENGKTASKGLCTE